MELNSPELWRWIWLGAAIVLASGEMLAPATFFFLPFAFGAALASVSAFFGAPLLPEWIIFTVGSIGAFAALWPLGRRLERTSHQEGVGAMRWVGQEAKVVGDIAENGYGTVRLEREVWRAESLDGSAIPRGSVVVVTRLTGTRLVVVPVDDTMDDVYDVSIAQLGGDHPQGAN